MAEAPYPFPVPMPALLVTANQESAVGKTHLMTTIADVLTLADVPFVPFQADAKPRLQKMLGTKVTDLQADPNRLLMQPALLRSAYTPVYTACSNVASSGGCVLLDGGAKEIENLANFMEEVDIDEDLVEWQLPMIVFVPVQADPEAVEGAVMTWKRLQAAVPSARLVLVENLFDRGRINDLKPSSPARRIFEKELKPLVGEAPHLVMPAIVTDFWQPFEEAGARFLKVMAMNATEGAKCFGMMPGDFKIARGNVTRFFQHMQGELAKVLDLPGGDV